MISNKQTNNLITQELNKKKKEVTELIQQLHIDAFENVSGKSNEIEFETKVNGILNKASSCFFSFEQPLPKHKAGIIAIARRKAPPLSLEDVADTLAIAYANALSLPAASRSS